MSGYGAGYGNYAQPHSSPNMQPGTWNQYSPSMSPTQSPEMMYAMPAFHQIPPQMQPQMQQQHQMQQYGQPQGEIEWIIEGSVTQLLKEAHREKIRTAFDLEFKNHLQTCLDNLEANKMLADALHGKMNADPPCVMLLSAQDEWFFSTMHPPLKAVLFTATADISPVWAFIAEAFGRTCSFGQVRCTNHELISEFNIAYDTLPQVVAVLTRMHPDGTHAESVSVRYNGKIDFQGVSAFLEDLKKTVYGEGPGLAFHDGRPRSLRWADEMLPQENHLNLRDRLCVKRMMKSGLTEQIHNEMLHVDTLLDELSMERLMLTSQNFRLACIHDRLHDLDELHTSTMDEYMLRASTWARLDDDNMNAQAVSQDRSADTQYSEQLTEEAAASGDPHFDIPTMYDVPPSKPQYTYPGHGELSDYPPPADPYQEEAQRAAAVTAEMATGGSLRSTGSPRSSHAAEYQVDLPRPSPARQPLMPIAGSPASALAPAAAAAAGRSQLEPALPGHVAPPPLSEPHHRPPSVQVDASGQSTGSSVPVDSPAQASGSAPGAVKVGPGPGVASPGPGSLSASGGAGPTGSTVGQYGLLVSPTVAGHEPPGTPSQAATDNLNAGRPVAPGALLGLVETPTASEAAARAEGLGRSLAAGPAANLKASRIVGHVMTPLAGSGSSASASASADAEGPGGADSGAAVQVEAARAAVPADAERLVPVDLAAAPAVTAGLPVQGQVQVDAGRASDGVPVPVPVPVTVAAAAAALAARAEETLARAEETVPLEPAQPASGPVISPSQVSQPEAARDRDAGTAREESRAKSPEAAPDAAKSPESPAQSAEAVAVQVEGAKAEARAAEALAQARLAMEQAVRAAAAEAIATSPHKAEPVTAVAQEGEEDSEPAPEPATEPTETTETTETAPEETAAPQPEPELPVPVTGVVTAREPAVTQPEEEEKEAAAQAQLPGASDSQLETGPTELETEPAVTPQRTRMIREESEYLEFESDTPRPAAQFDNDPPTEALAEGEFQWGEGAEREAEAEEEGVGDTEELGSDLASASVGLPQPDSEEGCDGAADALPAPPPAPAHPHSHSAPAAMSPATPGERAEPLAAPARPAAGASASGGAQSSPAARDQVAGSPGTVAGPGLVKFAKGTVEQVLEGWAGAKPLAAFLFTKKTEPPPIWLKVAAAFASSVDCWQVCHTERQLLRAFAIDGGSLPRVTVLNGAGRRFTLVGLASFGLISAALNELVAQVQVAGPGPAGASDARDPAHVNMRCPRQMVVLRDNKDHLFRRRTPKPAPAASASAVSPSGRAAVQVAPSPVSPAAGLVGDMQSEREGEYVVEAVEVEEKSRQRRETSDAGGGGGGNSGGGAQIPATAGSDPGEVQEGRARAASEELDAELETDPDSVHVLSLTTAGAGMEASSALFSLSAAPEAFKSGALAILSQDGLSPGPSPNPRPNPFSILAAPDGEASAEQDPDQPGPASLDGASSDDAPAPDPLLDPRADADRNAKGLSIEVAQSRVEAAAPSPGGSLASPGSQLRLSSPVLKASEPKGQDLPVWEKEIMQEREPAVAVEYLTPETVEDFLAFSHAEVSHPIRIKALLFTRKQAIPPIWASVAAEVALTCECAIVHVTQEALLRRFGVRQHETPCAVCLLPGHEDAPVRFTGRLTFAELTAFIAQQAIISSASGIIA